MTAGVEISPTLPSPDEYRALMNSVGFTLFPRDVAQKSLAASMFCVTLRAKGQVVGMGRLVGDGICFAEIIDIVVRPDFQGHGHAKTIMAALMAFVRREMAPGAFVSLSAHVPANRLYAQFGFEETAPEALGMCYRVPPRD